MSKPTHIGAPACFALEQACKQIMDAFDDADDRICGIYVVGSCLERADWRDVDVRMIMHDDVFAELFPKATLHSGAWEFDPRWCLMTLAISQWLKAQTGLPVDFQFQPMTHANERHKGRRHAVGLRMVPRTRERVELPASAIGFTLNQPPQPVEPPKHIDKIVCVD